MDIPDITKRNYLKVLKELDVSKYSSFNQDSYLKKVKDKLANGDKLLFAEEQISFHRFKAYIDDWKKENNKYNVSRIDFTNFAHRPLLSFQETGVKFLLLNDRCILADDTGLGKSIESIIAALCLPENYKVLIVTLKSLKYNFAKEISYYSDSYKVIEKSWESGYKFTIVNYDSLKKWKDKIDSEKFDCIISDEAHYLINSKSIRAKSFTKLAKQKSIKKIWLLTGTPLTNRPFNYYNLLKLVKHPVVKNWKFFVEQYCDGYQDLYKRWITDGHSNEEELYNKTKDKILRRLKKDYLPELPNKDRQPVFLHLKDYDGYNKVIKNYKEKKLNELIEELGTFMDLTEEDIQIESMTKLILWRQYCALEKIRDGSLFELISTQLDQGDKIVVFTNFTSVVDAVYNHFTDGICSLIDGRIKSEDRLRIVEEFNTNNEKRIMVCNLQVGGVGLNITSANVAIINDMYWVPGTMLQAEDRLWRIGQKKEVLILYPIYENTVEAIVYKVIDSKMKIISSIVEGKTESYFNEDEEDQVLTKINKSTILQEIFAQLK